MNETFFLLFCCCVLGAVRRIQLSRIMFHAGALVAVCVQYVLSLASSKHYHEAAETRGW